MLTVIIVTFSMRSVYEPSARLEVDPPGETFSLDGGNGGGNDDAYVETQAQNLKSDKLAVAVIRKLHLDQNPNLVPDAEERAQSQPVTNPESDGVLQLTPAENTALGALRSRLSIRRDTASRLITVSFADYDPQLAAQVSNTVVNTFIEQGYEEQHDSIMKSSVWLSKQLDDIRAKMEDSNRVLTDFQQKIGVADLDDNNKSTFSEQMEELNRQLTQAEADRIQIQAMLRNVRVGSADWLPEVRDNPVVQQLSEKLADAQGQLSQATVVYGKNHPNVKKLQNQVDELSKQLNAQKLAIVGSLQSSYDAANAREQLMNSQIKGTTTQLNQMARYNALKKDAQANSELYNSLYARVKEAGISAASKSSNLRVVDEARVLDSPTRPNRLLNLAVGTMAALMGSIALAFLREQIDARIFTPEDMQHSIGTANVSIVPQFFLPGQNLLPSGPREGAPGPATSKSENFGPWVRLLLDEPHSPGAEALRALYTSVVLSRAGSPPQVTMVVSSLPAEGKTTVAVNLAVAMAQHGSTCIVDADLRRGRVASEFGITSKFGLTDVLAAGSSIKRAYVAVPSVPNLVVVPAHPGNPNAGQLICSEMMSEILQELRSQFRFVVVDSAPLLPFADGRALATLVDGLVFVGRSGITTHHVMRRSLELLDEVHGAPVLEFVLNAADITSAQYRYYQYGYDYYRSAAK